MPETTNAPPKVHRYIERTIKEDGKPRVVKITDPDDKMLALWARKGGRVSYSEMINGKRRCHLNMQANEARELLRKGTKA